MVKSVIKKSAKRTRAIKAILIHADLPDSGCELFTIHNGEKLIIPWEVRTVTPQLTKEEKEKANRIYRKEYSKKPAVMMRNRERAQDPNIIAKKKEYAEREDVKLRKKELAARARAVRRVLKETQPENYANLQQKVIEALEANKDFSKYEEEFPHYELINGTGE